MHAPFVKYLSAPREGVKYFHRQQRRLLYDVPLGCCRFVVRRRRDSPSRTTQATALWHLVCRGQLLFLMSVRKSYVSRFGTISYFPHLYRQYDCSPCSSLLPLCRIFLLHRRLLKRLRDE